jgi:gliding motility-associated-like protein
MPYKKHLTIFIIALIALLMPHALFAQVPPPIISYNPVSSVFSINVPIAPLMPNNAGGPVPAAIYGQVTTVAGNSFGFADGVGTLAKFNKPIDITFDKYSGAFYIADNGNFAIRRMTPGGVVSTYAGGTAGYADGNAAAAKFSGLASIGIDALGNVWVSEIGNQLIRKIDLSRTVSTVAGTQGMTGNTDGIGTTAKFNSPGGLVFDAAGILYECDYGAGLIRSINTTTGVVKTFAGNAISSTINGVGTAASFYSPRDLAFDKQGNLFVGDVNGNAIRKIDMTTLQVSTVVTGAYPFSIAIGAGGNIYISDLVDNVIKELSPSGKVTVLAGNSNTAGAVDGVGTAALFNNPYGITLDDQSNLYVADNGNNLIRKINLSGYSIDKALPTGLSFDKKTGIISGTPTAAWPLTAYTITGYNTGGSSETVINLEVDGPSLITFNPIPAKTICDVDFDPGATSTKPITYTSSNANVATIVAGKIHITGAGTSTITANNGGTLMTQVLTVTAPVVPSVAITSEITTAVCAGRILGFDAVATNAGNNPTYQWKVNGTNIGTNSPVYNSNTLSNNDVITCVVSNNDYCIAVTSPLSNPLTVQINPLVTVSVTISATAITVYEGTPITFTVTPQNAPSVISYQWYINTTAAGTSSPTFISSKLIDGDVITCTIVSGGCVVDSTVTSNAITVAIKPIITIVVPNAFTPNGDGINDLWNIPELVGFPNSTVAVYNRYGALVYHSIGYTKSWNGMSNNSALPVGTYYYIIDPKNTRQKIIKGWVSILR